MEKIKKLVAAGSTRSGAVKEVLAQKGLSIAAFAERYDRNYAVMTSVIAGSRSPAQADVDALIAELGGSDVEWREFLHEAGRPIATAS